MVSILIVDDESRLRNGLQKHIPWQEIGITHIYTAGSGKEALEIFDSCSPDILLTDIRMPQMDGIELATLVRQRSPECGIVFLSAYSDKDYLKSAIKLKAFNYVEKPVDTDELKTVLREAAQNCRDRKKEDTIDDSLLGKSMKEILEYIHKHYWDSALSINEIAEFSHFNPQYLCRYFRKNTGTTINDYISKIRIEKAKELLSDKQNKLSNITQQVGYSDPSYFAKIFKKYCGFSPAQYRER